MAREAFPFQRQLVVDPNRVSRVSVYQHIPQLVLGEGAPFDLGFARLSTLTFDDWVQLEIPVSAWMESAYKRANPSFLITERLVDKLPKVEETGEGDISSLLHFVEPVHWGLVMTLGPLLSPSFSSTYVRIDPAGETLRFFGPLERDMLTTSSTRPRVLNQFDVEVLRSRIDRLRLLFDLGEAETVLRALDGIRLLEDAETSVIDAVAQTVQVIEDIVNPDGRTGSLARNFASRLALILSKQFSTFERWQDVCSQLYTIRNDIIHGYPVVVEHLSNLETSAGHPVFGIIWYASMSIASVLGALVEQYRTGEEAEVALQNIFAASLPLTEERFLTTRAALRVTWFDQRGETQDDGRY